MQTRLGHAFVVAVPPGRSVVNPGSVDFRNTMFLSSMPHGKFNTMLRYFCFQVVLPAMILINAVTVQADELNTTAVRVMSFNIRYGTAKDGVNHWDNRREFVVDTIKAYSPDLLGTQETLKFQRDYLAEHLPDYAVLGVGRDDGKDAGEMMALYYRRDRFEELQSGHFWLSETPEVIGSKSWDSSLPRMVTWVKLTDRKQPDALPILFFNTHFDHLGGEARRQSALLIRSKANTYAGKCRVIITGDFNAAENSDPYKALFEGTGNNAGPVVDSFRAQHPVASPGEGTFSGFKRSETAGGRIDWIAVSRNWTVIDAQIDRTEREGRTPSDHFPVTAILSNKK